MKELGSKIGHFFKKVGWELPPGQESPKDPTEFLDFYAKYFMRNAVIRIVGRHNKPDEKITPEEALSWANEEEKSRALQQVREWLVSDYGPANVLSRPFRAREYPLEMIDAAWEKLRKNVLGDSRSE